MPLGQLHQHHESVGQVVAVVLVFAGRGVEGMVVVDDARVVDGEHGVPCSERRACEDAPAVDGGVADLDIHPDAPVPATCP